MNNVTAQQYGRVAHLKVFTFKNSFLTVATESYTFDPEKHPCLQQP